MNHHLLNNPRDKIIKINKNIKSYHLLIMILTHFKALNRKNHQIMIIKHSTS